MYALCIIDLQECFSGATFSKLISSVTREINLAKKLSCPILVLEYYDFGKTESWVKEAIGTYPAKYRTKKGDNGSRVILRSVCGVDGYRICGINTDACVIKTVCGLIRKGKRVEVVKDGCWSGWDRVEKNHPANHANGIRQIRNLGVKVLRG